MSPEHWRKTTEDMHSQDVSTHQGTGGAQFAFHAGDQVPGSLRPQNHKEGADATLAH